MRSRHSLYRKRGILGLALAMLLVIALACAAPELTATPVPPAPPAAPTAAPAPVAPVAVPTPTVAPLVPTPARALPTPTPVPVAKPQYGGTVRWGGEHDFVRTLDPIHVNCNCERPMLWALFNTLVEYGPDFGIKPSLAKAWDTSRDGKTLTFRLQEGVKFHDDTDFNAEAVKFTFDRILNPDAGARARSLWLPVIDRIEVLDKNTVSFHLKNPFRPFLALVADVWNNPAMVSAAAVAKFGKDFPRNPVGTGPFKLKEWVYGARVILARNDKYWEKGLPYLDSVVDQEVSDPSVRVAMLRTAEMDIQHALPTSDVELLKGNPRVKVVPYDSCRFNSLRFSVDRPPWNNKALRQALAYSIDRKVLIDILLLGQGRPGYTPEGDCFWWSNPKLKAYELDLAKAKEKMKEAGYPTGIEVEFWSAATAPAIRTAEVYQAMMEKAGFKVKITQVPAADSYTLTVQRKTHFGSTTWVPRPDPHGRLNILFHSKGDSMYTGYNNPTLDRLIDQAVTIYDQTEAKKLYDKIQEIILEDLAGHLITYFATEFTGMSVKVQNYVDIPDRMIRFKEIWMTQ